MGAMNMGGLGGGALVRSLPLRQKFIDSFTLFLS